MIFFSSSRLAACFFASFSRLTSRFTIDFFAIARSSSAEREAEGLEQGLGLLVGLRGGGDGDIHSTDRIDLVVVDFREDDLFLHTHVEVAAAIERLRRNAAEVAHPRQRDVDQPVKELVHPGPAQGHLAADRPAVTDLERGHRHARLGDHRLLAGDLRHVGGGVLEHLLVRRSLAHAHVERDLADLRHLHRIGVAELLHQLRHHFILVERFQTAHFFIPQASSASPLERNTRIRRPSSSTLVPMRSPLPEAGLNGITLDTWIEASRSITPPGCPAWGLGLVWRLMMLTLDTITRSPSTRTTSPRLPLSLPATTITWSPFLIRLIAIIPVLRSQHFGSERDDLHELLGAQLAGDRPEDTGADRLVLGVQKHGGVAVEADQRAVGTAHALAGTHHHGVVDLALLHLAARDRFLHRHLDDVADRGVAALGTAEHLDAHHFPGAGVVCHVEVAFGLDHVSAP